MCNSSLLSGIKADTVQNKILWASNITDRKSPKPKENTISGSFLTGESQINSTFCKEMFFHEVMPKSPLLKIFMTTENRSQFGNSKGHLVHMSNSQGICYVVIMYMVVIKIENPSTQALNHLHQWHIPQFLLYQGEVKYLIT